MKLAWCIARATLSVTMRALWREAWHKRVDERLRLSLANLGSGNRRGAVPILIARFSALFAMHYQIGAIADAAKLKPLPKKTGLRASGTNLPLFGRLDRGERVFSAKTLRRSAKRSGTSLAVDFLDGARRPHFGLSGQICFRIGRWIICYRPLCRNRSAINKDLWNGDSS